MVMACCECKCVIPWVVYMITHIKYMVVELTTRCVGSTFRISRLGRWLGNDLLFLFILPFHRLWPLDGSDGSSYPYCILSLADKHEFLQKHDDVCFQLATSGKKVWAWKVAGQRKFARAKVSSVKGQVK